MDFSVLSSLAGNDGKTICPAVVGKKIIYIYIYIIYVYESSSAHRVQDMTCK